MGKLFSFNLYLRFDMANIAFIFTLIQRLSKASILIQYFFFSYRVHILTSLNSPLNENNRKDNNRFIRFTTSTVTDSIRAHQTLNTYAFPGRRNLGYLFAFESRRSVVMSPNSVSPPTPTRFQFEEEFEQRLKLVPSIYYSKVENKEYNVCGSYPLQMIVPRVCGNGSLEGKKMLRKCAAFRSEQRLPALTWARSSVHAGIWRCSQPKVGIQGNRSAEDERYLRLMGEGIEIRRGSGLTWSERFELTGGDDGIENIEKLLIEGRSGLTVKILDMRSKASAMGNRGTGKWPHVIF